MCKKQKIVSPSNQWLERCKLSMIAPPMFSCLATDDDEGEGEGGDGEGDSDSCFVRLLAEIDGGVTRPGQTVTAAAAMAAERTPETQRARGFCITHRLNILRFHME